ncbi:MAG: hypothetical protein ACYC4N_12475 [Pirellulaceae bacterium]
MRTSKERLNETLTKASHTAAFLRDDLKEAISLICGDPMMQAELVRLKIQAVHIAHRLSRLVAAIESELPQSDKITCDLCGSTIQHVEAAIEAGWIPSYFDGETEVSQPVCPECSSTRFDETLTLIREPGQFGSPGHPHAGSGNGPDRPSENLSEDGTTGTPTEQS